MGTPAGKFDLLDSLKNGGPHLLAVGLAWLVTFFLGLWIPEVKESSETFVAMLAATLIGGYAFVQSILRDTRSGS